MKQKIQSSKVKQLLLFFILMASIQLKAQVSLNYLGRFSTGYYNNAGAEITAYDPNTKRVFVTNAPDTSLKIVSISNPSNPTLVNSFSLKPYGVDLTSVTCKNGIIAIAVIDSNGKTNPSNIVFIDANGNFLNKVKVGPNADMITFTPDGKKVLVANEGEPNVGYTIDPEGSVSIIDISGGISNLTQANVSTATFTSFNNTVLDKSIRVFGRIQTSGGAFLRNSTVAEDMEPEYLAVSDDNKTVWATCQENNCIAEISIDSAYIRRLIPLGFKNHSVAGNGIDASDNGTSINIANYPVFGLYDPDGITYSKLNNNGYLFTANEGDARADWGSANVEEVRFGATSYVLDTVKFGGASAVTALKSSTALGRLTVSNRFGDFNNDGKMDSAFCFGGRSFSIWDANTGNLVWDSKDALEQITASKYPSNFNASHTSNSLKNRSDDKGPEPEAITLGKIGDSTYAFVGLERIGGIMVFNVTNPTSTYFVDYINTRNFSVTPGSGTLATVGDLGPEGLVFVPASQSPIGKNMIILSNEISGTVSFYEVKSKSDFQLQILHASDMESGIDAVVDAPNFAAVLDKLEDEYTGTLKLASGDCYIPGPFLSAGEDVTLQTPLRNTASSYYSGTTSGLRAAIGRVDIAMMNIMGFQGSALGNHEFDLGTSEVNSIIGVDIRSNGADKRWIGAQFPFLSANLDFSKDINLSYLYTSQRLLTDSFKTSASITANAQKKGLAPSAIAVVNGKKIGLVGATTQLLASISSPGSTTLKGGNSDNMPALAAVLQPVIDSLRYVEGINKIIVMSHLQQLANEEALAPLLKGVDIIIAGGSHSLLADSNDRLRTGHTAVKTYPIMKTNFDGEPLAILNTTSEWKYIGRFVVDFDSAGVIIPSMLNSSINGAYAADSAMVTSLYGTYASAFSSGSKGALVRTLTTAIGNVIKNKDGNKFGKSSVFLEGRRNFVRTEETNLGNVSSDANLWIARRVDPTVKISIKNGGGVRSAIGEVYASGNIVDLRPTLANPSANKLTGDISQLDIENSLRFNNKLSILSVNAAGLRRVVEHGVSATFPGATPGQFPQVGGIQFSYDTSLAVGRRIKSLVVLDSLGQRTDTVVRNGQLYGDTTKVFRLVTLDFLAGGGDNYPFPANGFNRINLDTALKDSMYARFQANGTEQDAFAEYMYANFRTNPYVVTDTDLFGDSRIQLLNVRKDSIFPDPVFGISTSGANGSIYPSDTVSINFGSNQTYIFTPDSSYWIDSVIVNGILVPTASTYTFNNVRTNQNIRVTFRSLESALANANICSNDTTVATVNLPAQTLVRAVTYYSNIYLFNQNTTNNAYKYNVNNKKYTAIANKPTPCIECGVAEAYGKVYCYNTNGSTESYDIATNTWLNQSNQPNSSSSSVYAVNINNLIYILGSNNNQNTFYLHNPLTNSYSSLATPSQTTTQSRLVAFNNKIYKIGGSNSGNSATSSVEVYNPSNNTWTSMPNLPEALTQVGATFYDNKLYVFGGKKSTGNNSNNVYVFDFTSNAWYVQINALNFSRDNIEAKTANNMIFLFGGTDANNTKTNQVIRYFCKDQLCNCKWAE